MRVLFINNDSDLRCGIRLFGDEMAKALQRAGVQVTRWNGCYPEVYARGHKYLPDDWHTYDLVHLNWHPQTLNHYVPGVLPPDLPLSLFVNDPPPNSSCPVWDRAKVRWTSVPDVPGTELLIYPVPDHHEVAPHFYEQDPPVIGWTGIRGDGRDALQELCQKRGWRWNGPTQEWLSTEDEIDRLGESTVNVCWYFATRGVASAPMMMAAARRPLLVNRSAMFDHLHVLPELNGSVYVALEGETLEQAVDRVLEDVRRGSILLPHRIVNKYGWGSAAKVFMAKWLEIIK